jgi:hypothetical protein
MSAFAGRERSEGLARGITATELGQEISPKPTVDLGLELREVKHRKQSVEWVTCRRYDDDTLRGQGSAQFW